MARDGHEVTLLDNEPARLEGLEGGADLRVLCGSATSLAVLRQAGAGSADAVVALTGGDSRNALICGLARSLGARNCLARIRDVELAEAAHESGLDHIGIDQAISPEGLAVEALLRITTSPGCVDAIEYRRRCPLRRHDRPPLARQRPRESRFGHRWHLRQGIRPPLVGDGQGTKPSRPDLRHGRHHVGEAEIDVPGDQIADG